jgi:hypothetical protein
MILFSLGVEKGSLNMEVMFWLIDVDAHIMLNV